MKPVPPDPAAVADHQIGSETAPANPPAPVTTEDILANEEDNPNQRRYNMYPQKSFGGHVETKVLQDGRIKYTIFPFPFDGSDKRVIIVDPANPEEMRAVKQLHLIPDVKNDPGVGVYVFDADLLKKPRES